MNLKYNIVWFEDSQDFIDSLKASIEQHLNEQGFLPEFICKKGGEDALKVVEEADAASYWSTLTWSRATVARR